MSKKPQQKPVNQVSAKPAETSTANKSIPAKDAKSGMSLLTKWSLILAVITFILYANTLQNGYVLDDVIMLRDNTIVAKGLKGVWELLTTPHMRGYLIVPNDDYRPLSLVMFAIEYQFFGANPMVNHFFNIVVFAGCVMLFFTFLHRFFDEKKPVTAFIGALLFALHPIHTEVVANVKSRDELLCFLFAFIALNVFMKYVKDGKMSQLVTGSVALFLSIISKENTITLMGVIPVLFFLYKNDNRKRSVAVMVGSIASIIVFMMVRTVVLNTYQANISTDIEFIDNALVKAPDVMSRFATAILISGNYIKLFFVPYPLLCNYSYKSIPFVTFANIGVLLSMAVYGFIIWYAVTRLMKKAKDEWAFSIIFFLMTVSIFTNIFMLIGAEMAERFMFMPSAAWCMAGAIAIDKFILKSNVIDFSALKNPKILAILVPLSLLFGGMVIARNIDWKDNVNLYRVDLEKSPNDCRLNYYLGTALAETVYAEETDEKKRVEIDKEALMHLRNSLAIFSEFSEANAEMGRIYDRERQYDSAEYYDLKALKINPGHATATNNLGSVYLASGKYRQAIDQFSKALSLNFDPKLAYFNLARTYGQLKNYDSAIIFYKKTIEIAPLSDAIQELATAYFSKGRYDSAEYYYNQLLTANPKDATLINNIGAIYLNTKNYAKAIDMFNRSLAINASNPNAYSNLGRAYYFNKQYDLAIETFNKELNVNNKSFQNIPYIALSFQAMGKMDEARKYEAIAKKFYSDFKLN